MPPKLNKLPRILSRSLIISVILMISNSCSWNKCKVEGMLLIAQADQYLREKSTSLEKKSVDFKSVFIEKIISPKTIEDIIEKLELKKNNNKKLTQEDFFEHLIIEVIGASDVVRISYKHSDDKVAVEIINSLMQSYAQSEKGQEQLKHSYTVIIEPALSACDN